MRRHDLAYVRPGSVVHSQCGMGPGPLMKRIEDWIENNLPLVVARQPAGSKDVLLGLTLPASENRKRIGCIFRYKDVLRIAPPISISSCLGRLPKSVAEPLAKLESRLMDLGVTSGVYGSLAWETVSAHVYRHRDSDVDLICDVSSLEQYAYCIDAIVDTAIKLPCGLDGEIRFPDQRAVAWKELAAAQNKPDMEVLVKGGTDIGLVPLYALLEQFDKESAYA